ncbi:hypothetical protein C2E23DRAFT_742116 [Lenzites betulinus]|nr:hypothetical protein C2E23DRAFT_742116 [Lenzites betulinus]
MDPPNITLFCKTRDESPDSLPTIALLGGIPLFTLVLAPSAPLAQGTKVTIELVGPRRRNTTAPGGTPPLSVRETGIEGGIVAARKMDEKWMEVVVRSNGWSRAKYAAVAVQAIIGISVEEKVWRGLRSPAKTNGGQATGPVGYTKFFDDPWTPGARALIPEYPPIVGHVLGEGEDREKCARAGGAELKELEKRLGFRLGR